MKRSAASFLILAIINIVYFWRVGLVVMLFALLFFAVVPAVSMLIWCWIAPVVAEYQYIRLMGWSAEEAEKYRSDLRDAANAGVRKAKGQRALVAQKMNNRQPVTK